ncbi:5-methyltetrahydropteroyltriglutamate--homocysteine S-methyltransferase [Clostridium tyrobutyricum]|jgi:5-methyltetrahydropteroyltriglutamate--homocysteine methyltransferase|uniref:5-methyltetrahydropteroyltriglutamate-- homocysteine S-methyltransferase n=1 Tax=Clostridium tyrobutyricum TaxID=1519 RepID=UPI0003159D61|nr:5-methyltetrahydropteroyltriglutamate--homocysteine S-methyltransferase [Clostridium tyrobutyricum]MBV4416393.1 5-methyltetrahydropteroyltriglutamate--homocysteine S-methyltransferase [Clostridium tyrobutyricum]MBV4422536.1 5-methyltetrahydropteroyltriglutamate--homocysteine S-methyltransferase [Clostridium tyrobutyricum]MBV4428903.1 5-methyltetrahydropteroyltriglutamate--homocysteine S-methyltransferase [Clostridium tyrobutyricum]MBV4444209.1 5-methyltetrahydropteroyltriglutamate--homocyste
MNKSTIVGYPRIGVNRELKFAVESYFKGNIDSNELFSTGKKLRDEYWSKQKESGLDIIPSNDFSYYDNMLDMAFLLNIIPQKYKDLGLSPLDTYFAMARGYQNNSKDIRALPMKKWFNTNYHYIVPEIDQNTIFSINDTKPFDLYRESKELNIETKPVIIGIFTFLKLSNLKGNTTFEHCLNKLANIYIDILDKFQQEGIKYLQIDEPILVTDLTEYEIELFKNVYDKILNKKYSFKTLLQTYFGDIRDIYENLQNLKFNGIGLDFVEGKKNLTLLQKYGFPDNKILIAGIVNGKNIWRNDYKHSIQLMNNIGKYIDTNKIYISTSCSLLHVPYTVKPEGHIDDKNIGKVDNLINMSEYIESLSFAEEKLNELSEIKELLKCKDYEKQSKYIKNQDILKRKRQNPLCYNKEIRTNINNLKPEDFTRKDSLEFRKKVQNNTFKLPLLPTTTIGSFPQTHEIKKLRKDLRGNTITKENYENQIMEKIKEVLKLQEDIGLDVLVHGEYERADMVEYFGRLLDGFLFTKNGWVQSYGTRAVKPPIIYGDVKRTAPMTLDWIKFAQDQTDKPVKGMLTGPITILNWSFPREDLDLKQIAYQIGLAIGEEVLDLESEGIKIIQIDEAALREKLPLRTKDWHKKYLDWAIPAFRLTNSKVKSETQIHTHMCYSEFSSIVQEIKDMDADVYSIEAARSDFSILDFLKNNNFKSQIGPGIYDIHSPRIPSIEELEKSIKIMLDKIDCDKLWINPDCGLKTRGIDEVKKSLINMVLATKNIRKKLN